MNKRILILFLILTFASCSNNQESFSQPSSQFVPNYYPETLGYDKQYLAAMRYVIVPNIDNYPDCEFKEGNWVMHKKYSFSVSNYIFECQCALDGHNQRVFFHIVKDEEFVNDITIFLSDKTADRLAYIPDYTLSSLKDFYTSDNYRLTFGELEYSSEKQNIKNMKVLDNIDPIKEDLSFYAKKVLIDTVNLIIEAYEEAKNNYEIEYYNDSFVVLKYQTEWENYRTQHYLDYIYSRDDGYRPNK